MNKHASALGKLGRGKPKVYSADELAKRTARLKAYWTQRKAQKYPIYGYDDIQSVAAGQRCANCNAVVSVVMFRNSTRFASCDYANGVYDNGFYKPHVCGQSD